MNEYIVVVKSGKDLNLTLASLKFDEYGDKNNIPIYICDSWEEGFQYAKNQKKYSKLLFLDSGTVILSWKKFVSDLTKYPFKGMIAHLIYDRKNNRISCHEQALLIDLSLFPSDIKNYNPSIIYEVVISEKNIHHDYTPLWVKPNCNHNMNSFDHKNTFFQKLLLFHLNNNKKPIFNWNNNLRGNKIYLYNTKTVSLYKDLWREYKQKYLNIAENQFWILNNEKLPLTSPKGKLLTPGSGTFWIFSIINENVETVSIADISKVQINFINYLIENWDGKNYGDIVVQFIKKNNIRYFQLDDGNFSDKEKITILYKNTLSKYINQKFNQLLELNNILDFSTKWKNNIKKVVQCEHASLLSMPLKDFDTIWCSNILNYKWTYLHHDQEQVENFCKNLSNREITL